MALQPHLDLEQGGVLVLVALAALVASEHGFGVQTSGVSHLCKDGKLYLLKNIAAMSHTSGVNTISQVVFLIMVVKPTPTQAPTLSLTSTPPSSSSFDW